MVDKAAMLSSLGTFWLWCGTAVSTPTDRNEDSDGKDSTATDSNEDSDGKDAK